MAKVTARTAILRLDGADAVGARDSLAAEEPLEIRVGGRQVAVTMRTPGDDFDLVAGFLLSEGAIQAPGHIARMRYCTDNRHGDDGHEHDPYNIVEVDLGAGVPAPSWSLNRTTFTSSSCGICGKSSIEAVHANACWSVADDPVTVRPEVLYALPDRLRERQKLFDSTGGLHGAALFDAEGGVVCAREDVGRHNAVDKVVGWALREDRLPLRGMLLAVSGRASFELVQKAAAAGIPVLAAVSAPSSLAVELAETAGLTLAGFVRGNRANVYSRPDRIARDAG
ncbi:MAG TPA: formate dehydrogenase accessory sulfurtransferase FdhD [Actinospica sp.]|jgi:FdhD protein|nr:formate dehydrogenase accessory sulfurtransferase FdhD [Actinospica sp.]